VSPATPLAGLGTDAVQPPAGAPAPGRPPRSERFRPDIQALRAVAVLAVVLYHLWPARVPGGFVGVDVFFVISGYLITRHLADQLARSGRIDLADFWARRIRRLLPAAFAVLFSCLLVLAFVLPPVTWLTNLDEIGAAAAYGENWLLAVHAVDYLAAHDSASLVQHYWSLSVEEQFYLGWPLLLILAALLAGRTGRLAPLRGVRVAVAAVGLVSLAVSVLGTAASPAVAFFATPTRGWEFAAGGLLALSARGRPSEGLPALRAAGSWAGLLLIASAVMLLGADAAFPGWIATVPVLGAVLVVAGGTSTARWAPTRLQALAPVQWLGDHSYAVYLWHWPLIIAAPWVLHGPVRWPWKLLLLGLALVLALGTKRFVEDPVRRRSRAGRRSWPAFAFALAGMALTLALTSVWGHELRTSIESQQAAAVAGVLRGEPCLAAAAMVDARCPRPFDRPPGLDTAAAAADFDPHGDDCQQNSDVTTVTFCAYGETGHPAKTLVLVGNSHAVRLVPALDRYGREHGWRVLLAAKTDCLGLSVRPIGTEPADDTCVRWSADLRRRLLAMPGLTGVVFATHVDAQLYLAGHRASPAAVDEARRQVLGTWSALRAHGIPVAVVEDVPGLRPESAPECIARSRSDHDPCALPRDQVVRPNLVTVLAESHPRLVTYLRLTPYLCDPSLCHALIGGVVVYSDAHHLTTTFSLSLAPYMGPQVAAALHQKE